MSDTPPVWATMTRDERHAAAHSLVKQQGLTYARAAERLGTTVGSIAAAIRDAGSKPRRISAPKPPPQFRTFAPPAPPPTGTPRLLEYHHEGECRWPVHGRFYCCEPAVPGKMYCAAHCAVAYRPAPPILRKAARAR